MPCRDTIQKASEKLKNRTVAQIRTKLNNIIREKQKLF